MTERASGRVATWAPWVLASAVAAVYVARDHEQLLAAACAGAAVLLGAQLVIRVGRGGDLAAVAGAIGAAVLLASAGPWAAAASTTLVALAAVLVLAALVCAERVAAGGGAVVGIAGAAALGVAVAFDRAALALAAPLVVMWLRRAWHGARWALAAPLAGAGAALLAGIAVWIAGRAVAGSRVAAEPAPYAIALADVVGAIAVVAAAGGIAALVARRSTRWSGAAIACLAAGGALVDAARGGPGALPIIALAVGAGAGIARLARLAGPPVGQACLGGAVAVIVALPAVLAVL